MIEGKIKHLNSGLAEGSWIHKVYFKIKKKQARKIPHTGDTNSLDRCG